MKRITKLLSLLCAVSLVLGTVTIPTFAATSSRAILSLDYEPESVSGWSDIFSENFEGTQAAFTAFSGTVAPAAEVKTENGNKYIEIDSSDWTVGGYTLSPALGAETYKVAFDFNFIGATAGYESFAAVALTTKTQAETDPYSNNFRILGCDADGNILVNEAALSGTLACTIGGWYHYEMIMDKVAGTYSVEITRTGESDKATQTGTIATNHSFDGLMFASTANVAMDNIVVSKPAVVYNVPKTVTFENGAQMYEALVEETGNSYCEINAGKYLTGSGAWGSSWINAGYLFSETITTGEWAVSFRFNAKSMFDGYAGIALANNTQVKGNEYKQFGLLSYNGTNLTVNKQALGGTLKPVLNQWYDYRMVFNKDERTYSVEISDGTNTATGSGTFTQTEDFNGLMFSAGANLYIDDIYVVSADNVLRVENVEFFNYQGEPQRDADSEIKTVKIAFSSEMNESSLANAVSISDSTGIIPASGKLAANKTDYILTLPRNLTGEILSVSVDESAVSLKGSTLGNTYIKTFKIANPYKLLEIDYDNGIPTLENLERADGGGVLATATINTDGSGNKYCTISRTEWVNIGYSLAKAISRADINYRVKFDFSMPTTTSGYVVALSDKSKDLGGTASVYDCLGLLSVTDSGGVTVFRVAGVDIPTDIFEGGDWYTYEFVFNPKTRAYSVLIYRKNNPSRKAEAEGILLLGNAWGDGIPTGQNFDAFKFMRNGEISVDNISVSEYCDNSLAVNISSDYVGNIFGGNDAKEVTLGVKNTINSSVSGDITYTVKNEKGIVVDSGEIDASAMGAREYREYPLTLDLRDYGVYEMYVDVTADGRTHKYNFDLSVINKRSAGESLNPKYAVNTLRPGSDAEWENMRGVMLQAGISGMRTDLRWYEAENPTGVFTKPSFTKYYGDCMANGIDNLVILNATNPAYASGSNNRPDTVKTDAIWTAWEKYVDEVSKQYKDEVAVFEIINEPDYYGSLVIDPADYCEYLRRAKAIIDVNSPDSVVVGLSTASVPFGWIESVLSGISSNPTAYLDAISVHPYDFSGSSEYGDPNYMNTMGNGLEWSIAIRDNILLQKINRIKTLMAKYNCSNIPLWFTEMGISSTPGLASLSAQGRELSQLCATLDAGGIERTFWYCLENVQSRASNDAFEGDPEANFGLVGSNNDTISLAAKPAYVALAGYNKMMNGYSYKNKVTGSYTPASISIFNENFESTPTSAFTAFNGWAYPVNEIKTDNSNYAEINAGKYITSNGELVSDWVFGGYTFDQPMTTGTYKVSFDFNLTSGNSGHAAVSLANKANAKDNTDVYNQFALVGYGSDGKIKVNKADLGGSLSCTTGNWYHYEMTVDKSARTYSVEITQSGTSAKATASGTVPNNMNWDGLMFGANALVKIDNISVVQTAVGSSFIYLFENSAGDDAIVLWGDYSYDNIALDLGTGSVEIFDKYSNKLGDMVAADGIYNFTATPEPIFIKGHFTNPARVTSVITASNGKVEAGLDTIKLINLLDTQGRNLRVETKASSGIQIMNNPTIISGIGSVHFKVTGGGRPEESLEVFVYDGAELVYYTNAQIHVENIKMVSLEVDGSTVNVYSQITDGTKTVKIAAENIVSTGRSLKLMTAYYSSDDVLQSVEFTPINIPERGVNSYGINLNVPSACETLKIFAWNDMQTPFCKEMSFIK